MSELTASLVGGPAAKRSPWPGRFAEITRRLEAAYGTPTLGNVRHPLWEAVYILLSSRTADRQYRATFRKLKDRFPTFDLLAAGDRREIRRCIEAGGLARNKAGHLKRLAKAVVAEGPGFAARLKRLPPAEAFAALTALPGIGPKSALCVMMYSLDADVFPVDINVQRVAERLGALPKGLPHHLAQRLLPGRLPAGVSRSLHIGLVVLGREVCVPNRPKCGACCLADLCRGAKRG